jgi:hypothetical protein
MALLQKHGEGNYFHLLWWFCYEEGDGINVVAFFYGGGVVKKALTTHNFFLFFFSLVLLV